MPPEVMLIALDCVEHDPAPAGSDKGNHPAADTIERHDLLGGLIHEYRAAA